MEYSWTSATGIEPQQYECGHCGNVVGPNRGYEGKHPSSGVTVGRIYICSFCSLPTYISGPLQVPGSAFGRVVEHLETDIQGLFDEARNCMSVSSFTSAVLACRKVLMHVSADLGAKEGQTFLQYVNFLETNGHIPPRSKGWVDHIRKKGNEANHEIRLSTREEAELLISFVEMLLRITYEFPGQVPPEVAEV